MTQSRCRGAVDKGAGIVLGAINTVGISGQRRDPFAAINGYGKGQQKLRISTAATFAAQRDGGLAARQQHHRLGKGSVARGNLFGNGGMDLRHVARLAFN